MILFVDKYTLQLLSLFMIKKLKCNPYKSNWSTASERYILVSVEMILHCTLLNTVNEIHSTKKWATRYIVDYIMSDWFFVFFFLFLLKLI